MSRFLGIGGVCKELLRANKIVQFQRSLRRISVREQRVEHALSRTPIAPDGSGRPHTRRSTAADCAARLATSQYRLGTLMDAADIIRDSIAEVERLRQVAGNHAGLAAALAAVKHYQSQRFAATYSDLIAGGPFQAATTFFLAELYGEANYSRRDAQFSRIAGVIQHWLPKAAIATAVTLARLHVLTERLDQTMGQTWSQNVAYLHATSNHACYALVWQLTGQRNLREQQLQLLLEVGHDLDQLTRTSGLRRVLKMMRRPAQAADLSDLQHFLEKGFDIFATLGQKKGRVAKFLEIIKVRESAAIIALFDGAQNRLQPNQTRVSDQPSRIDKAIGLASRDAAAVRRCDGSDDPAAARARP
ncbi:MAG: hypothetical protein ABI434_09950 [Burkholderiaceae bacterium]